MRGVALYCALALAFGTVTTRAAEPRPNARANVEAMIRRVVELTNAQRSAHGLLPLKLNEELSESSQWMCDDMSEHTYFSHTDSLGHAIGGRIPSFGYSGFHLLGENIAAGQPTPEIVVAGWMKSPGHRANILNPGFSEIGVGYATGSGKYATFWAQDFGNRFDVYPVVINNEARTTRSTRVKLSIYGSGWARRMRFSNDGYHWSRWEPFRSEREWRLEPGIGKKTVYADLRSGDDSTRASDSVELNSSDDRDRSSSESDDL